MNDKGKGFEFYSNKINNNGKRAHHNALERRRRDHIKESFYGLRDVVPIIHKSKISRAQILKKATEYLQALISQNKSDQTDIEEMLKQNKVLEQKIMYMQKMKYFENNPKSDPVNASDTNDDDQGDHPPVTLSKCSIPDEHSYSEL
ncbi:unnamed protein product [Gordionus sp. m RMFG-2023]|uniref:protein max-like n=1 Tax=Gordionus sp. m RMFG-2023 TaxID=3053472 RepID=UPI0030E4E8C5